MTHRERVLAVLNGEILDVVPSYMETPMDVTVFRSLLPPSTGDWIADSIARAELFGNSAVSLGIGIDSETLFRNEDQHTYRYETGAVWRESYRPTFCREAIEYPVNTEEDALTFRMPSAPAKCNAADFAQAVKRFKDAGYFVQGDTIGAWQSIYYFITSFENILMWMLTEPEAAHALFDQTSKFSLEAAECMLRCGVDAVFVPSDFGSGNSLLFSPALFREYPFPWLKQLADLCHSYGARLHLHSHGHIEGVMDMIVEAGVDMINPVGPSDHNDLAMFKEKWGDKITFMGGVSTTIAQMSRKQIEEHVAEVMRVGRVGGRFFPRTESGIPPMERDEAMYYVEALKRERMKGYQAR